MYKLQRITKEPATALRVQISLPSDGDAGLAHGGTFWFAPAGDPGGDDVAPGLSEAQARAVMDDPGLAVHFTCTPALPAPVGAAPVEELSQTAGDGASKKKTTKPRPDAGE